MTAKPTHPWRTFVPGQLQHKPKPKKGAMR